MKKERRFINGEHQILIPIREYERLRLVEECLKEKAKLIVINWYWNDTTVSAFTDEDAYEEIKEGLISEIKEYLDKYESKEAAIDRTPETLYQKLVSFLKPPKS